MPLSGRSGSTCSRKRQTPLVSKGREASECGAARRLSKMSCHAAPVRPNAWRSETTSRREPHAEQAVRASASGNDAPQATHFKEDRPFMRASSSRPGAPDEPGSTAVEPVDAGAGRDPRSLPCGHRGPADPLRIGRLFGQSDERGPGPRETGAVRARPEERVEDGAPARDERKAARIDEAVREKARARRREIARGKCEDETRERARVGGVSGHRNRLRQHAARAARGQLERRLHEDQTKSQRYMQRNGLEGAMGIGRRHEDDPSEERREDVVAVPRAVGRALALQRCEEQLVWVGHAEEQSHCQGSGGGGSSGRPKAARKGQALLEGELDPARQSSPTTAPFREDRGGGHGGSVAARIERQAPSVARDGEDAHTGSRGEPGRDDVSRPVQRGTEDVEADPEVRDGGRSEHRDGSTPPLHQVATTLCNALTALSRSLPSTAKLMLHSDEPCAMDSTFTFARATAAKTFAAIPGVPRIPSPTAAMTAMGARAFTESIAPVRRSQRNSCSSAATVRARSPSGITSAMFCSEDACENMTTETPSRAVAENTRAAMPGMPVIPRPSRERRHIPGTAVTARMPFVPSPLDAIVVPRISGRKELRMTSGIPSAIAGRTAGKCRTFAPKYVISAASR